jgi:hypothetical protein
LGRVHFRITREVGAPGCHDPGVSQSNKKAVIAAYGQFFSTSMCEDDAPGKVYSGMLVDKNKEMCMACDEAQEIDSTSSEEGVPWSKQEAY